MARIPVRLNLRGINRVLRKAQPLVDQIGSDMANEAGPGFEYVAVPHEWTARGYVQVDSLMGARRQADEAVLERVVSG